VNTLLELKKQKSVWKKRGKREREVESVYMLERERKRVSFEVDEESVVTVCVYA